MPRAPIWPAALAILALPFLAGTCGQPQATPVMPAEAGLGALAYAHVAKVVGFGSRDYKSPGRLQALDYIAAELTRMGLKPIRDRWRDPVEQVDFENIRVLLPGSQPDRIVIACHHDTKCCSGHEDPKHNFTFVGANDSGSGVGLLLALAQVLPSKPLRASYELVFFDGEESMTWGWNQGVRALFGSKRFVAEYVASLANPESSKIRALVLLDMVGAKDLSIDRETNSNERLIEIFAAAASQRGAQRYFFQNSIQVSDDHVPFLEAGIPSIDLIDIADNPQWHTEHDTLAHIDAGSLQIVGDVVLTALPEVEAAFLPRESDLQFRGRR